MTELEYLRESFDKAFSKYKTKNIVLYGLGFRTEKILESFSDFNIVGLLDGEKSEGHLGGKRILTLQEAVEFKVDIIIVVAQESSTKIIYKRIYKFCSDNNIKLYNMYGRNLFELIRFGYSGNVENEYYKIGVNTLKESVLTHDIISFDIFNTLLMHKTLFSGDVFDIVENRAKEKGLSIANYKNLRIKVEKNMKNRYANLNEIYDLLKAILGISEDDKNLLLELEISVQKQLIISRREMAEIIDFAVGNGKKVYLISDTYLPRDVLIEILDNLEINRYNEIFLAHEYDNLNSNSLFGLYKKAVVGNSYLHIGENNKFISAAKNNSINVFIIKSAIDMLKISSYAEILSCVNTVNERSLVGLFIANVFNSPFSLYKTDGRPRIDDVYELGYLFIAPLVSTFIMWLLEQLEKGEYEDILFSARDGFLIQQLYNIAVNKLNLTNMPKGIYFETSRTLCTKICAFNEEDIKWVCELPFAYSPEIMLQKRFELNAEEVLPYYENKYKDIYEYALKHKKLIYKSSVKIRDNYFKYLDNLGLVKGKKYALFDFVSSGTCQLSLSKVVSFKMEGIYFGRYLVDDKIKNKLPIRALFENGYMIFDKGSYMINNYMFLETIITSSKSSLASMDSNGNPIYCEETRTEQEIKYVEVMHRAITKFFNDYIDGLYLKNCRINKFISDRLYSFKDLEYTNEKCSLLDTLMLRDDFGQGYIPLCRNMQS